MIFMCLLMRKGAKGGLDRDGGGPLFMDLFYLFGARYQLGHCPVSCSSCNIDFIYIYLILFCFILFYFILFYFIYIYLILFCFVSFHFISFHFISFYFILFYFILFYFILFYFTYLFYANKLEDSLFRDGPLEK